MRGSVLTIARVLVVLRSINFLKYYLSPVLLDCLKLTERLKPVSLRFSSKVFGLGSIRILLHGCSTGTDRTHHASSWPDTR